MPKDSQPDSPGAQPVRRLVPLTQPLRHPRFRQLWMANLVSNFGTWIQTFASAWLIASLAHDASTTTLVQTATYVPIFLFALFAGAIADRVDRPRFLFNCNLFLALCATGMAVVVMTGHATPWPVLALTFCLGAGNAFSWPAWQAAVSSLVDHEELEAAATLNNLSYNVAAVAGPALGGLLFGWIGPGALFLANAVSFTGLLLAYASWSREPRPVPAPGADYWNGLKAGLQTAFACARFRFILRNIWVVFFTTIAFPALLPVFVRDVLKLDSHAYGALMGSLGGGAILAAFALPHLRVNFDRTRLLAGALVAYGVMLLAMPALRSMWTLAPLILMGGMAWSTTVSTMNAAAQASFPLSMRARAMSIYLFTMAFGYTVGSVAWGHAADRFGVGNALMAAGACILLKAAVLLLGKRETRL
jgi:predicted MFS family arabinose efflux permease